jgi:integrase
MSIRKRGDRYQVRVRLGSGERVERTLPAGATRADAQTLEATLRRRQIDTAAGRPVRRLIDEALTHWVNTTAVRLKSYDRDLRYRIDVLRGYTAGRYLDEAPALAERIKSNGAESGLGPAAINRYLAILRRVCNLAVRWGWTDVPIGQRIVLLGGELRRDVYLTPAEVRVIIDKIADPVVRDFAIFAVLTGMRRSEILRLLPEHLVDGAILTTSQTKSARARMVGLPPQALRIAQDRLPWSVTARYITSQWEAARKAAGRPDVRLHDLRHAHATWLVQGGAPLTVVRDQLGHSSLAVTSRYSHAARPDIKRAVRRLKV